MAKNSKKKKAATTDATWFVAEDNITANQFVSDVQNGQPVWTTNLEEAVWATKKTLVLQYIERNNLNAKPKEPGGLHPGTKPPLL